MCSQDEKKNILIQEQSKSFSKRPSYNKSFKSPVNNIDNNNIDINYDIFKNDIDLNLLNYRLALLLDKRTYIEYYWSLLKQKQLILFTFVLRNDYNLLIVKISFFLFIFSLTFNINGFFFTNNNIHQLYKGNGQYDLIYEFPHIIFSSVVSYVISIILKSFILPWKDVYKLKMENNKNLFLDKCKNMETYLKIKLMIFFIINFIFMSFFWYFISCFCAVFVNTQIALIKNTIISFILLMIYPFGINLLPGVFRISALKQKNKRKNCIYKIGQIIALF